MATARQLQWTQISDFTPGIADDPGAQYPAGQAQRTNTFRCIANHDGALIPLPARTTPNFDVTEEAATPPGGGYCLTGLYSPQQALLPTALAQNLNVDVPHELFVGVEWLTGANHRQRLRRFRVYETPGTASDLLKDVTFADVATTLVPVGMSFAQTRVLRATPTSPGIVVVMALCPFGATNSYLVQFPNDATPTLNTPFSVSTAFILNFTCHQGRTVIQQVTAQGQGVDTTTFMGESLAYTPVNDSATFSTQQVFDPENSSGFAFMVQMSANELFVVKSRGGLYITGSIADPVVVNLPMVQGTRVQQVPAVTGVGVVYGDRNTGMWAWQHGDTSRLLSPRLFPNFFVTHATLGDYGGNQYQFATFDDWILFSNNWLYDTTNNGWWRLEDDTIIQTRYMTTFDKYIYGADGYYFTNEDPFPIHRWDRSTSAHSMSWQSQPQCHTLDTRVDIREVTIKGRGKGSVIVTFTAQDGTTDFAEFTFDDDTNPKLKRANVRVQGDTIVVKIVATGGSLTAAAPTVYDVSYGFYEAQHVEVNS